MSSLASWTYVYDLTVWPVTYDELSQPVYGTPYLLLGDWASGGQASTDSNGVEFMPVSTYYFEAADGSELIPKPMDYILRGDNTAEAVPPATAETIKKVGGWGMDAFGVGELPDWQILT